MRVLQQSVALGRSRMAAARPFASLHTSGYGRTAAYRRIERIRSTSKLVESSLQAPLSSPSPQSIIPLLRARLSPQSLLSRSTSASFRSFHSQARLLQEAKERKPEEDVKASAQSEGAEKEGQAGPEAESQAGKQEAGEKEEGQKSKEEDKAPPPPHGDKTPWQVFTETLQSEFKKSKEWNESTKQLASGYQEFTQNENLKRMKSAYTHTSDAVGGAASSAIKSTGRAIGHGAAWTWDTSVVKGIRAGANATGRGIEKVTRPVRQTEAYKNVKEVIDDGSSSRYGGWIEKEERQRRRELREAKRAASGELPSEPMVEDPNAGTNVTLHKDHAWQSKWQSFRDSSKLMQSLFAMKSTYQESENPLISTARSVSDRIAGFFAENETAMVIKKFREMDPGFQLEPFLQELREYILPEVLDAYVKGDTEVLQLWLSAAQYQVYAALMQQYTNAGLKSDGRILDIRHVDIISAKILDPGDIPIFLITCRTQEVHVYRNIKSNELAAGMDDKVQQVTYVIGITRIPEDVSNPETRGWRLIELQKSARDYI